MSILQVRKYSPLGVIFGGDGWNWYDAWPSSIELGYPSSSLGNLPSGVKKLEITHPDGKVTYVPFASEGNEYWEKQTSNGTLNSHVLTIDGKYPLKLKEYVKFDILYNIGPNISGSGSSVYDCWNNYGAFAYINNISSSLQNPEDYYLLLIGRSIPTKSSFTVNGESLHLTMTALAAENVAGGGSYYSSVYSILGNTHGNQWIGSGEAGSWGESSATIHWLLVTDVTSKNQSWSMSTPNPNAGGNKEEQGEYISGSTRGIPPCGGLVSYIEKTRGAVGYWESGYCYSKFFLENGSLKPVTWWGGDGQFAGWNGVIDYTISSNVEFNIVAGGSVTLTGSGTRQYTSSRTETYTDAAGYQQTRTVYYVSGSSQPTRTTDYIIAYI
jgi:hypothetical protein